MAAGIFAGTNVDDILVLTVLFLAAHGTGAPRHRQIVIGQYAGILVLVAVSAAAALGLAVVPGRWVPLLGALPLGLGIAGLVRSVRDGDGEPETPVVARGVPAVAALTIANGADNIAVYTPAFRRAGVDGTVLMVAVFLVLVAVWCAAASRLGAHPAVVGLVRRTGHRLVPAVFVGLGCVILAGFFTP
jgi:cadmium resistance protein CadD (predicted permease)